MAKIRQNESKAVQEIHELQGMTHRLWEAAVENPTKAAAAVGGALALILVVLLGLHLKERAAEKRLASVSATIGRYLEEGSAVTDLSLRKELEDAAAGYGRSVEGAQARYYLGGLLDRQGEYASAVESFLEVKEKGNANLANAASLGLAYTYRLMGDDGKALETFEKTLEMKDTPLPRSLVRFEIARIRETMGETEAAAAIYRELVAGEKAGSALASKAKERLEGLQGS